MYPFVVSEEKSHGALLKHAQYPIPQLWPKQVVKRYIHFNKVFHEMRQTIFNTYEASGGEYHGPPPESDYEELDEEKQSQQDLQCDLIF